MYWAIGYVDKVEKKTMRNGGTMTKFRLSVPMGKKDDDTSRYYTNFWTSFKDLPIKDGDKVEMTGDVYDRKSEEGKYTTEKICSMATVLFRKQEDERKETVAEDEDNIPF